HKRELEMDQLGRVNKPEPVNDADRTTAEQEQWLRREIAEFVAVTGKPLLLRTAADDFAIRDPRNVGLPNVVKNNGKDWGRCGECGRVADLEISNRNQAEIIAEQTKELGSEKLVKQIIAEVKEQNTTLKHLLAVAVEMLPRHASDCYWLQVHGGNSDRCCDCNMGTLKETVAKLLKDES
ncbi:MAG: hypothetical protein JRD89_17675, partial [Deltaproteobacteria bacterium]|nr:hypothetical protein [Deltaproteobacteria bacterium]